VPTFFPTKKKANKKQKMGIKGLTKLLSDSAPGCMREQKFEGYLDRKAGGCTS
jgi:hypothetical protein